MSSLIRTIFLWMQEKEEMNYLYFFFILTCLCSLNCMYFLFLGTPLLGVPLFFFLYALGQTMLEVGLFILSAYLLKRLAPKWAYSLLTSIFFALLVLHFTDFIMLRLLDTSIMYFFNFFLGHGIMHITSVFQAINMNQSMIAIIITSIIAIPFIGIALHRITEFLIRKRPLQFSFLQIIFNLAQVCFILLLLEIFAYPHLTRLSYMKYRKTLPLGMTFFSQKQHQFPLTKTLAGLREETTLQIPTFTLSQKPNIYLFVIETLRKDFIHEQTAPNLTCFGKENIQFASSFSNANGTPHSWFAIFHSTFPHHWKRANDQWKNGSIPLQILKKAGYQIRVYSSADLRYFHMDTLLFGTNRALVDSLKEYGSLDAWQRDAQGLQSFTKDIDHAKSGNIFIFFLDSTHSEYSVPPDFPLKFQPVPEQIRYLTLTEKDLEPIKNRYRNAITYIDSLMGEFFMTLQKQNLYEDAIIAITGDHGEEFFEEGALFHGTHLNYFQTSVPIFFKFQKNTIPIQTQMATHLDIFPSILYYLQKDRDLADFFDGEPVFQKRKWPYRFAVQQNGSDHPSEFMISKEDDHIRARFLTPNSLEILSIPDKEHFFIESYFPGAFDPLLSKENLFQKDDSKQKEGAEIQKSKETPYLAKE